MTLDFFLLRRLVHLLRDILFSALYFGHSAPQKLPLPRRLLSWACLSAIMLTITAETGSIFYYAPVQQGLRLVCFSLYIRLTRQSRPITIAYYALFWNAVCYLSHNLFLTPMTRPLLLGTATLSASPTVNAVLCILTVSVVTCGIYIAVLHAAPYRENRTISPMQIVKLVIITLIGLYTNQTLRVLTDSQRVFTVELSIYALVQQGGFLFYMILMEKEQLAAWESANAHYQMAAAQAELKNAEHLRKRDETLRTLWHDMKNHLCALRVLAENQANDEALQYIDRLLHATQRRYLQVNTGHPLIDGLLSDKLSDAFDAGVDIAVACDLTHLQVMDSVDLCIIFANAIDNALEAVNPLPPQLNPYIQMRSTQAANFIIIQISNPCQERKALLRSSLPETTKRDAQFHGMGLKNIRRALSKYGGSMETAYDAQLRRFTLTLALPAQPEDAVR